MIMLYLFFDVITLLLFISIFFFFNDTATTEIYTLSLHDALPIWADRHPTFRAEAPDFCGPAVDRRQRDLHLAQPQRSEEHTSELQSHSDLVCRLLLEKKKKRKRKRLIV